VQVQVSSTITTDGRGQPVGPQSVPGERGLSHLGFRWQQLLVVLAAVVPLLLFSGALLVWSARLHREAVDRGLADTAHALSIAVDQQIAAWQAALSALATSPAFDSGDFAALYPQALAVAEQHRGWIVVFDATMQQRLNTLRP
jgi:hypothetical protein